MGQNSSLYMENEHTNPTVLFFISFFIYILPVYNSLFKMLVRFSAHLIYISVDNNPQHIYVTGHRRYHGIHTVSKLMESVYEIASETTERYLNVY